MWCILELVYEIVVYFLSCCLGLITLCNFIIGKWVALVDFVPFFSLGVALCN